MHGAHSRHRAVRSLLASICLFACLPLAAAATPERLELGEAVDLTLARNPDLIALGFQLEAQQGRVLQSAVAPAAEFGLMVENVLGTGIYQGAGGAETTLSLGWILERGKRQNYIDLAAAGASVFQTQIAVTRLETVAETSLRFLDVLELQEHLLIATESVEIARRTSESLRRRVGVGRTSAADLARAEARFARANLDKEDLEHRLETARHLLAAQWGVMHPEFDQVIGDWRQLAPADSFEALLEQVAQSPEMMVYLDQERLRQSELRLAEARARPDWRIEGSIRRFDLTGDHAFVAAINIPLSSAGRNRGYVAEARAKLAALDAEREASRVRIEAQLFALYQELEHSQHLAESLRDQVLPPLREAEEQVRRGYEAGGYSYYELQDIQTELQTSRVAFVQAAIDAHRFHIEIERLTGAAMPLAAQQSRGLK